MLIESMNALKDILEPAITGTVKNRKKVTRIRRISGAKRS
jgi:hypothetical protein